MDDRLYYAGAGVWLSLARAPGLGPGGRRFESCHPDFENIMITFMREWLRGGAPPCQGGGRGFESRLALFLFSEDPGFAGSFIFVYKNEKAGSEEPAIHGTIRSAPFS